MTSLYENSFRIIGPLLGESTGGRWFLLAKASNADLSVFIRCEHGPAVEQTVDMSDAIDYFNVEENY